MSELVTAGLRRQDRKVPRDDPTARGCTSGAAAADGSGKITREAVLGCGGLSASGGPIRER
jgi:hypothetical protein